MCVKKTEIMIEVRVVVRAWRSGLWLQVQPGSKEGAVVRTLQTSFLCLLVGRQCEKCKAVNLLSMLCFPEKNPMCGFR